MKKLFFVMVLLVASSVAYSHGSGYSKVLIDNSSFCVSAGNVVVDFSYCTDYYNPGWNGAVVVPHVSHVLPYGVHNHPYHYPSYGSSFSFSYYGGHKGHHKGHRKYGHHGKRGGGKHKGRSGGKGKNK